MDITAHYITAHYLTAIQAIFETPRPGQVMAAEHFGAHHLALEAPTGSGKSGVAVALAKAYGSGQIVTHSNALASQYLEDLDSWAPTLGLTFARLAGRRHYWCPKADPDLVNVPVELRKAVLDNDGCFIGVGLREFEYRKSSLDGLRKDADADEAEGEVKSSECSECDVRAAGVCPLWNAREAAARADIVVTNAALSAVALKVASDPELQMLAASGATDDEMPWIFRLIKGVLVIDEADSCESLYRSILVPSRKISRFVKGDNGRQIYNAAACKRAGESVTAALMEMEKVRHDQPKINEWLEALGEATPEFAVDQDREGIPTIELRIPARMDRWFKPYTVVAMSATLVHAQARWLGIDVEEVFPLPGLDLSNCEIVSHPNAPSWAYAPSKPNEHDKWAKYVAGVIKDRFQAGATAGLFQSKADMQAVEGHLNRMQVRCAIYVAGEDREAVVAAHKANPTGKVLLGCFAGAGRGVNLPGDLLEHVVISRIPQNPPRGASTGLAVKRWKVASAADVLQAAGRVARYDLDRGTVDVIGGFGSRSDVREGFVQRGWPFA